MARDPKFAESNTTVPLDIDAVVGHFVHAMADSPPSKEEVFRNLKSSVRWSEAAATEAISRCLERRTLSLKGGDSGVLIAGGAFDFQSFPRERAVAERAKARATRKPHIEKTQHLREAILAELSTRSARSTGDLWIALEDTFGGGSSGRRKLERYLADLDKLGQVQRDDYGWWDAREKDLLAEHATYTALRLLHDLVNDIVPYDLQKTIAAHVKKAEEKLKNLSHHDPAARWARAFRIMPPRHRLDDPVINPDVKDAIEEAILTHRKVRLKWPDFRYDESHERVAYVEEQDCSVSHYLIEVPANPSIEIWYDGWMGGKVPHRLPLNDVLEATVLPEIANYPSDHEPELFPGKAGMRFGDAGLHDGSSLVTLAMSRETYLALSRKELGKRLTVVEEDRDGRMIVSLRYPLDVPVTQYFEQLPGVAVVGPKLFRAFAMGPTRAKMQAYKDTAELAKILASEEDAQWQEFDRLRSETKSD